MGESGGGGGSESKSKTATDDIPAHLMPSEEEIALFNLYEQVPNNDHTAPPSMLMLKHTLDGHVPKPPLSSVNEGKNTVEITEQQQLKAVVVLSMLGEMGVEGKTYDQVLTSLVANNWDENGALGSFF